MCVKQDQQFLCGNTQLWLGKKCGIDYYIHFEVLLICNQMNRILAHSNFSKMYISLTNTVNNSFQAPSNLFVDKTTHLSQQEARKLFVIFDVEISKARFV